MTSIREILLILVLVVSSAEADAHAVIIASSPGATEVVSGSELAIEIRFNSRIDASRSRLTLLNPDGAGVILTLNESPVDTLKAKATDLRPGAYRLHWQTLSLDGHITQGDIPFNMSR